MTDRLADRDVLVEVVQQLRQARGRITGEVAAIDRAIDALARYGESTEHDEHIAEQMEAYRNAQ